MRKVLDGDGCPFMACYHGPQTFAKDVEWTHGEEAIAWLLCSWGKSQ